MPLPQEILAYTSITEAVTLAPGKEYIVASTLTITSSGSLTLDASAADAAAVILSVRKGTTINLSGQLRIYGRPGQQAIFRGEEDPGTHITSYPIGITFAQGAVLQLEHVDIDRLIYPFYAAGDLAVESSLKYLSFGPHLSGLVQVKSAAGLHMELVHSRYRVRSMVGNLPSMFLSTYNLPNASPSGEVVCKFTNCELDLYGYFYLFRSFDHSTSVPVRRLEFASSLLRINSFISALITPTVSTIFYEFVFTASYILNSSGFSLAGAKSKATITDSVLRMFSGYGVQRTLGYTNGGNSIVSSGNDFDTITIHALTGGSDVVSVVSDDDYIAESNGIGGVDASADSVGVAHDYDRMYTYTKRTNPRATPHYVPGVEDLAAELTEDWETTSITVTWTTTVPSLTALLLSDGPELSGGETLLQDTTQDWPGIVGGDTLDTGYRTAHTMVLQGLTPGKEYTLQPVVIGPRWDPSQGTYEVAGDTLAITTAQEELDLRQILPVSYPATVTLPLKDLEDVPYTTGDSTTVSVALLKANGVSFIEKGIDGDTFHNVGSGNYELDLTAGDLDSFGQLVLFLRPRADYEFRGTLFLFRVTTAIPTCRVTFNVTSIDGSPIEGRQITARQLSTLANVTGNAIYGSRMKTQTNNAGYAELALVRGARVRVAIDGTGVQRDITVPDQATAEFLALAAIEKDLIG